MTIAAADYHLTSTPGTSGVLLETPDLEPLVRDAGVLAGLQDQLDRRYVLHIRAEREVSPEAIRLLARALGLPEGPYEGRPGAMAGYEFIGDFSAKARDDDGRGRVPTFIESLHYDSYGRTPVAYSISHTRQIPGGAAAQAFVDMRALLAGLPADLKRLVTTHSARHGRLPLPSQPMAMAPAFDAENASLRPLAIAHWRTGEPLLFLPKHPMSTIEGLPEDEGREILADLWRRAEAAPDRYDAQMRSGDLIVWDNIGVTHTNPAYRRDADRTVWFFTIPSRVELKPA